MTMASNSGVSNASGMDVPMGITQQRRAAYETGSGRHGCAERRSGSRGYSSRPSDRERDRPDRTRAHFQNQSPQFVRFNAVGPEETADWLSALDSVNNRLDTFTQNQRSSSQTNSQVAEAMRKILNQIEKDEADVVEYKKYAQSRFAIMETVVSDGFVNAGAIINGQIASNFEALQERCKLTSTMLESLTDTVSKIAGQPATTTGARGTLHGDTTGSAQARTSSSDAVRAASGMICGTIRPPLW